MSIPPSLLAAQQLNRTAVMGAQLACERKGIHHNKKPLDLTIHPIDADINRSAGNEARTQLGCALAWRWCALIDVDGYWRGMAECA